MTDNPKQEQVIQPLENVPSIKPIPKPDKGKQGQEITYYQEEGIEYRKYVASGVIQRWNGDKWVFAQGTARNEITTDNASSIATSRWDKVRDAAMQGVIAGTEQTTEPDAIRELSRVSTVHALAGGKGGSAYLDKVMELADLKRPRGDNSDIAPGQVRLTATVDIQTLRRAMAANYAPPDAQVIDVTPKDVTDAIE